MSKIILLGILALTLLTAGCKSNKTTPAADFARVTLNVTVPPDLLTGLSEPKKDCPQSLLGELFGLTFSEPHGCIIGSVNKGGLAEQAGIKPGDSIVACNGSEVTCPSKLAEALPLGKKPGAIELVIHRPGKN